ncbi:MAG: hypothetical protein ACK481_09245 [Candidatus Melainabacteria bacterium]
MSLFLISDQVIAKKNSSFDAVEDISFQSALDSNLSTDSKSYNELGKETNVYYADNYEKPLLKTPPESEKPYFIPLLLIISLALVVVIMVLSNVVINGNKKKNSYAKPNSVGNSGIELIDIVNLDASKALYLIQYAGKKVLMASSWNSFSVVSEFASEAKSEEETIFPKRINKIPANLSKLESPNTSANLDFLTNTLDGEMNIDGWESIVKANVAELKEEKVKNQVEKVSNISNSNDESSGETINKPSFTLEISDSKANSIELTKSTKKQEVKKIKSLEISTAEDTLFEEIDLLVKAHANNINKEKNKIAENTIREKKQESIPSLIGKEKGSQSVINQNTLDDNEKSKETILAEKNQNESITEVTQQTTNLSLSAKLANNGYKPSWLKNKESKRLNTISEEIKKLNAENFTTDKSSSGDIVNKLEDIKTENRKAENQFSNKYESKFGLGNNLNKSKMFNTLNFQDQKTISKSPEQPFEASTGNSKFIRENQEIIEKFKELKKENEKEMENRSTNYNTQNNNSQTRKATTTIRKISMVED